MVLRVAANPWARNGSPPWKPHAEPVGPRNGKWTHHWNDNRLQPRFINHRYSYSYGLAKVSMTYESQSLTFRWLLTLGTNWLPWPWKFPCKQGLKAWPLQTEESWPWPPCAAIDLFSRGSCTLWERTLREEKATSLPRPVAASSKTPRWGNTAELSGCSALYTDAKHIMSVNFGFLDFQVKTLL